MCNKLQSTAISHEVSLNSMSKVKDVSLTESLDTFEVSKFFYHSQYMQTKICGIQRVHWADKSRTAG